MTVSEFKKYSGISFGKNKVLQHYKSLAQAILLAVIAAKYTSFCGSAFISLQTLSCLAVTMYFVVDFLLYSDPFSHQQANTFRRTDTLSPVALAFNLQKATKATTVNCNCDGSELQC